jgi:hypothetical protein
MEMKVRSLDVIEPKGVREVENELIEKHEQSLESDESFIQEPEPAEFNFYGNGYI